MADFAAAGGMGAHEGCPPCADAVGAGEKAAGAGSADTRDVPCVFWERGVCTRGDKCPFSHDLKTGATIPKRKVAAASTAHRRARKEVMARDAGAAAAKTEEEAPPPNDGDNNKLPDANDPSIREALYKCAICATYAQTNGYCPQGVSCRFAHGISELRSVYTVVEFDEDSAEPLAWRHRASGRVVRTAPAVWLKWRRAKATHAILRATQGSGALQPFFSCNIKSNAAMLPTAAAPAPPPPPPPPPLLHHQQHFCIPPNPLLAAPAVAPPSPPPMAMHQQRPLPYYSPENKTPIIPFPFLSPRSNFEDPSVRRSYSSESSSSGSSVEADENELASLFYDINDVVKDHNNNESKLSVRTKPMATATTTSDSMLCEWSYFSGKKSAWSGW